MEQEERLQQLLSARRKRRISVGKRVPAAVLVPIYQKDGRYHVLLTLRTDRVREHKGQVSFPGGTRQDGDASLRDTALRESFEEIGLLPGDAEVLGELDDELSQTTNYVITPFVAIIPWPYRFKLSRDETEEIIGVPIPELLRQGYRRQKIETGGGKSVVSDSYNCQGKIVWGATARILKKFLDISAGAGIFSQPGDSPS